MKLSARARTILFLVLGALMSLGVFAVTNTLPMNQRIMVAIFTITIFYWVTEPVPVYVTAILAAFLLTLLFDPLSKVVGTQPIKFGLFFNAFASPVVILMFGGFILARVFGTHNLDISFCNLILKRLGNRTWAVILGVMTITAFISMWMSNTAATALMVGAVLPLMKALPPRSNASKALMLSIPFAANLGGIATPIGTPPNAIAIGLLNESGIQISFLGWMLIGLPIMVLMVAITLGIIRLFFPIDVKELKIEYKNNLEIPHKYVLYGVFIFTIGLWLTDTFHKIPTSIVALIPVVIFAMTGLLSRNDLKYVEWDILILIGGGLALGVGIKETGLGDAIVKSMLPAGLTPFWSSMLLATIIAIVSTFMSHTAAANFILPLVIALVTQLPERVMISTAIASSFGMSLPISTPPNAIAYGSGKIATIDMFKTGILITIIGVLLTTVWNMVIFKVVPSSLILGQ